MYRHIFLENLVANFTGHRPMGLPWCYNEQMESCLRFKKDLLKILRGAVEYGIQTFLTGMAEGFDMIAVEAVIELKKEFPNIKLVAVVPCLGQEVKWRMNQQERYHRILSACDEKIVLSDHYTPSCMNERNK